MFFKKDQKALDAAFLKAVGKHRFRAAKKLLKKGANIHAVDAEGNTALHKLAGYCPVAAVNQFMTFGLETNLRKRAAIDEFVCLLLDQGINVNVRNDNGESCLFHTLRAKASDDMLLQMREVLTNRGASIYVQDGGGRSLLHIAASLNKEWLIDKMDLDRLWDVADNEGQYSQDYASKAGHYSLSQSLRNTMVKNKEYKRSAEDRKKVAAEPLDSWQLVSETEVAHKRVQQALGYKLTDTFNFRTRIHLQIVHNIETKQDVPTSKGFDEYADKTIIKDAYAQLIQCGGKADESSIYHQEMDKKPLKPAVSA